MSAAIPGVVKEAEGAGWPYAVAIEVSEHLLATSETDVEEEDDSDGLVAELRLFSQRNFDGRPTVLSVIDDEAGLHRDTQKSHLACVRIVTERLERDFCIDGGRDGRKNVRLRVVEDVLSHRWDAAFAQDPLGTLLWRQFFFVEDEDPRNQPQGAHRRVVVSPCLDAPNSWKYILK